MAFSPAFLDELNNRNPIEDVVGQYVALTRKGSNLFGLCPFHGEKTASFSVSPEKGICYCFGCHKGGGVVNFIMEIENLSYPDAVRFLAKRAGLEVPEDDANASQYKKKERLWALSKSAARFFNEQLKTPQAEEVRAYIAKRGLSASTVTRFGLGFAPNCWSALLDAMTAQGFTKEELLQAGLVLQNKEKGSFYDRFRNRLMFPIIDVRGNVIGFGGRVMDDSTPKYLNSPETVIFNKRRNLFAMNIVKKSKQGFIVLTEGYMDAIALHQYGFDCAVASLGTSLTQEHAEMLSKYTNEVVLIYDADTAGQNATQRAIPMLEKTGLRVRVLRMQGAKDPDEFLRKYGAERFRLLLEGSENQAEYRLRSLQMKFDLSVDEQKVEFAKQAAELISTYSTAVERELYGGKAAQMAGLTPEVMKLEIGKAYKKRISIAKKTKEKQSLDAARWLGADIIVIHTGSAAKISRGEAMQLAADTLTRALSEFEGTVYGDAAIRLGLETMGKKNQLGTLDEVIELCRISPRLVPVIDFFQYERRYYAVSEAVAEECQCLETAAEMDDGQKRALLYELALCLQRLHTQGVVHADLKPDHVLLVRRPEGWKPRLIDLDSGFLEHEPPQHSRDMEGDPVYLAPEAFLRMIGQEVRVDRKLDTFAFGIMIHQLWTGEMPGFDQQRYQYLYEAVLEGAQIMLSSSLPQEYHAVVKGMLSLQPEDRPEDAQVTALFETRPSVQRSRASRPVNGLMRRMHT